MYVYSYGVLVYHVFVHEFQIKKVVLEMHSHDVM